MNKSPEETRAPAFSESERKMAFAGVMMVLFLASINLTTIGSAMPRIISELGGFEHYAWAFTVFTLTSAIATPLAGGLSDTLGRRRPLLVSITIFSLASLALGFVGDMGDLIALRAVQGFGSGALIAIALTAIADLFPPLERGKAQAQAGAVWGLSAVMGPLLGGFITDHFGWRGVFVVNAPFALLAAWFIWRYFRLTPPSSEKLNFDWMGTALVSVCVTALTLISSWAGSKYEFFSPQILGLLALALASGGAYVGHAKKAAQPVLNLSLLKEKAVWTGSLLGFMLNAAMFAAVMYLPLYMQGVRGTSATYSGLTLAPMMGGMIVASAVCGSLVSKTGRPKPLLIGGSLLSLLALVPMAFLHMDMPMWMLTALMVLMGAGLGAVNSQLTLMMQSAVAPRFIGAVTGSSQFYRQIGSTLAVGMYGAMVTLWVSSHLGAALPPEIMSLPPQVQAHATSPSLLGSPTAMTGLQAELSGLGQPDLFVKMITAVREVMSEALGRVFAVGAGAMGLALLLSFLMPDQNLKKEEKASS